MIGPPTSEILMLTEGTPLKNVFLRLTSAEEKLGLGLGSSPSSNFENENYSALRRRNQFVAQRARSVSNTITDAV